MYYVVMSKTSVVAERIERLLSLKGMSVADLSRASGVSESALSNILSGTRKQPRSDTIQKIAKGFPTSTDYLNGYTDNHEPTDAGAMPEYAAEVLEAMRKLDRGRNYELAIIAKQFVENNEKIRQLAREELAEMILDMADQLGTPEETDRVLRMLEMLERRWQAANGDTDLLETSDTGEPPEQR